MTIIYGTNGNDRGDLGGSDLIGTNLADEIFGLAGDDLLNGRGGNDYLNGGAGRNTIVGGAGYDYVRADGALGGFFDGGADDDIMEFTSGASGFFDLGAGWATFSSNQALGRFSMQNFESLYTGAGFDTIWGTEGANEIRSGGGYDTVFGRGGVDTIRAGTGDDHVEGGAGNDWIDGEDGWDGLFGGTGNDMMYGRGGADLLWGGHGDDVMSGGLGSDTIDGGEGGFDTASFADLPSLVTGLTIDMTTSKATYTYYPGTWEQGTVTETDNLYRIDKVIGSWSNDYVTLGATTEFSGLFGNDNMYSGSGANRLDGGADSDLISYERSTAGVSVNLTAQTATGGWATGDVLTAFERAEGSAFADTLRGSGDVNHLFGGGGTDVIYGEGGADRLWGDAGYDQMWGGSGADVFIFASTLDSPYSSGSDWIRDFSRAQGDKISIGSIDANWGLSGLNDVSAFTLGLDGWDADFRAGTLNYRHSGGDTYVELNCSDLQSSAGFDAPELQIRLSGIHMLSISDFVL